MGLRKTLFNLVLVAAVAAAAVVYYMQQQRDDTIDAVGIIDAIGDDFLLSLQQLRIDQSGSKRIDIQKNDKQEWVVKQQDDYPADTKLLQDLVQALSKAKIVENKTSNPEFYNLLSVQWPADSVQMVSEKESQANTDQTVAQPVLLSLVSADSKNPFRVILGANTDGIRNGQYVRILENTQSLVISPPIPVPLESQEWLDKDILHVEPRRLYRMIIKHSGDGTDNFAARRYGDGSEWQIEDSTGGEATEEIDVDQLYILTQAATAVDYMRLLDVAALKSDVNEGEDIVEGTYITQEGLVISTRAYRHQGANYVVLSVSTDEHTKVEKGLSKDVWEATREKARMLEERVDSRRFKIGQTLFDALNIKRSALLK